MSRPEFIPLAKWDRYYHWPTVAGMRRIRFDRHQNGFADAFIEVGGRVLVDAQKFWELAHDNHGTPFASINKLASGQSRNDSKTSIGRPESPRE